MSMLNLGCVSTGSYLSTLVTAVSMVLFVALLVVAIYLYEMHQLNRTNYHPDNEEAVADLRELYQQFDTECAQQRPRSGGPLPMLTCGRCCRQRRRNRPRGGADDCA